MIGESSRALAIDLTDPLPTSFQLEASKKRSAEEAKYNVRHVKPITSSHELGQYLSRSTNESPVAAAKLRCPIQHWSTAAILAI